MQLSHTRPTAMHAISLALPLALLFAVPSCGGKSVTPSQADASVITPAEGQRILFEETRVSGGWGGSSTTLKGLFITSDGEVFSYEDSYNTTAGQPLPDTKVFAGMTESQLTAKHGANPHLITTVESAALLQKFSLVAGASRGTLLSQSACADFGDDRFFGYFYDLETSTYTPVPLGTNGDLAIRNTAPEGSALMSWIRSLGGQTGEASCEYRVDDCSKPSCPNAGPCGDNLIPVARDGESCASYCGAPSSCSEVASCSECNTYSPTCVIDQSGKHHCLSWYVGCESLDSISCACAGEHLCAGGADLCRGDLASGFSCASP